MHDNNVVWRLLGKLYTSALPVVPLHMSPDAGAALLIGPRAKAAALHSFFASKHSARSHSPPTPTLEQYDTTRHSSRARKFLLYWRR